MSTWTKALLFSVVFFGWLCSASTPGLSLVYAVVVVVAVFWYYRRGRNNRPARMIDTYVSEVRPAIELLEMKRKHGSFVEGLLRVVGLAGERVTPTLVSVQPAPFGARVCFQGLVGQDLVRWRKESGRLASALRVRSVVVSEPTPGFFQLDLRAVDPLERSVSTSGVAPAIDWSLGLGVDELGSTRSLAVSNVSGVVVGGLPGAGKTSWLTAALAGFASSDAAQFLIVDGKGGLDLDCLRPRSYRFLNDDLDLVAVLSCLREVQELARERVKNANYLFGSSNFWHRGPTATAPVVFVVIDECQTFLDPRQAVGKEQKSVIAEIHSAISYLVRKGRGAGIVTILATQKPTADSVPTEIRDNATLRICFGVQSHYAAAAVLGDDWTVDSDASPLGAPVGIGVAAINGRFIRFRAAYVPEQSVSTHVSRFAGLQADPSRLLRTRLAGLS